MSHAEYKTRYRLPKDYPSVASKYSAARSEMAKKLGLGSRGRTAAAAPAKTTRKKAAWPASSDAS